MVYVKSKSLRFFIYTPKKQKKQKNKGVKDDNSKSHQKHKG